VVDGLAEPGVGRVARERGGKAEVVQGPEDVVTPPVGMQEGQKLLVGRFAGAETTEEVALEEIFLPDVRACRDSGVPPVARSYSSSPSSTLIVEGKDERAEPLALSQFQPPSSSRSPSSLPAMGETSTPK
jgi:hypothetical protein